MKLMLTLATLASSTAVSQVTTIGDLVLVADPSGAINNLNDLNNMSILPSPREQFCRAAFNAARTGPLSDDFDGVITFSTTEEWVDLVNIWQGPTVRADATNIDRVTSPWVNSYNSSKLSQCVFMGTLGRTRTLLTGAYGPEALPANPDDSWAPSFGIQVPGVTSLTGIEMVGHEYGHHWLVGVDFDLTDGRGTQTYIRATTASNPETGEVGTPNQHYSHLADSRSVMYGECITPLNPDAGSYRIEGCARKYSHIDQYLMGLRATSEVSPMMVLEDPASPGQGVDSLGMGRSSAPETRNGLIRHDVGIADIIRTMGARAPAYPNAQRCWHVAFIVVLAPGQTQPPTAMIQKLESYRQRWESWFTFATDGRGLMDTRLHANACLTWDGGVDFDAGTPDAGTDGGELSDGGADAGADAGVDAGAPDSVLDSGVHDAGEMPAEPNLTKLRPGGCGCSVSASVQWLLALATLMLRRRSGLR